MKYDVFVSYSREDLSIVQSFVRDIEQRTNVRCWVDWNCVESGEEFEKAIVRAIDSVEIVLFFLSEHSMNSRYSHSEILYAFNTNKKVVPIVLDGGELRGWFLFKFGAIDYISVGNPLQVNKLMANLQEWCAKEDSVTHQYPPLKSYKVGDYYDDGEKQGVVFDVDKTGMHGKIVGLRQMSFLWCTEAIYDEWIASNAIDQTNGSGNIHKIMQIQGWQEKYHAFAWCANQGDGWYLPAIEELKLLLLNDYVHNVVNKTLCSIGATPLYNKGELKWYWSSTEENAFCSWFVCMVNARANYDRKNQDCFVRAVSAF